MIKFSRPSQQQGISLIELMISLVLGLLVLAAVSRVFVAGQTTDRNMMVRQQLQQQARSVESRIELMLREAGYRIRAQDDPWLTFPEVAAANDCPAMAAGVVIAPATTGNGICFRRQFSTTDKTCLGTFAGAEAVHTQRIFFNAQNQLRCAVGANDSLLASMVGDFRIRYGIRPAGQSSGLSYFTSGTTSPTDAELTRLGAVRLDLLMLSTQNVNSAVANYFFPLDAAAATTITTGDDRLYIPRSMVISIRNRTI
ncbi:PilW family protein [Pelagibaculum spongiae]|uniref:Prepilin-type cleavage/methylation domain-containing protein n=1 Tax=Pelagibaculum spongiae TaxID=2080658 RepID=A0A2V1H007_9GAMM|nr:prepilin-type N-terminal cleavage/methylation domain-containing protein [Pelagibaculum spongiae]PVZ71793.1 hypothetical protein DC094_01840 [Pelagibaculum spongiae]